MKQKPIQLIKRKGKGRFYEIRTRTDVYIHFRQYKTDTIYRTERTKKYRLNTEKKNNISIYMLFKTEST